MDTTPPAVNSRIHMSEACAPLAVKMQYHMDAGNPFKKTDASEIIGDLNGKTVYMCQSNGSDRLKGMRFYYYGDGYLLSKQEKDALKKKYPTSIFSKPFHLFRYFGRSTSGENPYQGGRRKSRRSKSKRRMTKRRR